MPRRWRRRLLLVSALFSATLLVAPLLARGHAHQTDVAATSACGTCSVASHTLAAVAPPLPSGAAASAIGVLPSTATSHPRSARRSRFLGRAPPTASAGPIV